MDNLSIIIKADEKGINKYIDVLEPLLLEFKPELIIIDNDIEVLNIPFKHSVYKFSGDYYHFKEFCFSSCLGKKMIIIENGLQLLQEHISLIIEEIKNNDYNNLSFNLKTYLSEDQSLSSIKEEVLVYNRGIKGFNKNCGLEIEDLCLVDKDMDIDNNIKKLIQENQFKEIYLWYEHYILGMPMGFQLTFYSALEKNKLYLSENDIINLEALFLQSKLKNNYYQYLTLRKKFRELGHHKVSEEMQDIQLTENELYYCWLIKDFIEAQIIPSFIVKCDEEVRGALFIHLLENDVGVHLAFYRLIMTKSKDQKMLEIIDEESMATLFIIKSYFDYFKDQSDGPLEKERLLEVFEVYLKIRNIDDYKNILYQDIKFIEKFKAVKKLLSHQKTEEAITLLKNISIDYPDKTKIIRYYIQKIRYETKVYPFILSICMITKDEEKNLHRCLLSLKPLLDSKMAELIIVDTGSRDQTLQIAKQYTKHVISYTWNHDFSEARNYANIFAEGEYIFTMDADEEFDPVEIDKISNEFKDGEQGAYHTFLLRIKSYTNLEHTQYGVVTQPRIFRNNGQFYYLSSIHNQAMCDSNSKCLDIEVLHYGYIMTEDIKDKKFDRTSTLLKKMLENDPRNIYFRYQLSSSYSMHGDLKEALKQVDIFIRLINESKFIKSNTLMYYNNAANIYLQAHRYEDADQVTNKALSIQPDFIDFLFYKAYILFVKGQYEDAIIYMKKYLAISEDFFELEISNVEAYTFYTKGSKDTILRLLIIARFMMKEYLSCLAMVYRIKDQNALTNCLYEIIGAAFYSKQYSELAKFYKSRICGNLKMAFIFEYFLLDLLFACDLAEAHQCISMLTLENVDEKLTKSLMIKIKTEKCHNGIDTLNLISKYYMDGMDCGKQIEILMRSLPEVKKFNLQNCTDVLEIMRMKIVIQCILYRTEDFVKLGILSIEELLDLLMQYIYICIALDSNNSQFLESKEIVLASKIISAFSSVDKSNAVEELNDAVFYYYEMRSIITLAINTFFSDHVKGEKKSSTTINNSVPSISIIENSKLQTQIDRNDLNEMKVLQGTADLTNRTTKIAEVLNSKGIYTKTLNYFPNYTHPASDYEMDMTSFADRSSRLNDTIDVASRLIPAFNIYHFHSFSSLTLNHSDLEVLREMNRKMLMHFWGQDVRVYSKAATLNPYIKLLVKNEDKKTISQLKFFSKYIKCCLVSDYELQEYVKDYFENVYQINLMVDLKKVQQYEREKERLFTIVHVSTSPELFGTQYILRAINDLKNKYNINFKLIQELSYDEDLLREADLIIDQLIIGRYGQTAIEALALGKPVICWISDFMKEKYSKDLPIIIANPDNIKEKITYVLENRDMLKDLGVQGRHYVEKYHDVDTEILKLINIYKNS